MYIVAIGWLYVTTLMAFTETSITAGVLTFFFYGLAPCALLLWLFGSPMRARARAAAKQDALSVSDMPDQHMNSIDGADPSAYERKLRQ
jgi:hypothetical protein